MLRGEALAESYLSCRRLEALKKSQEMNALTLCFKVKGRNRLEGITCFPETMQRGSP